VIKQARQRPRLHAAPLEWQPCTVPSYFLCLRMYRVGADTTDSDVMACSTMRHKLRPMCAASGLHRVTDTSRCCDHSAATFHFCCCNPGCYLLCHVACTCFLLAPAGLAALVQRFTICEGLLLWRRVCFRRRPSLPRLPALCVALQPRRRLPSRRRRRRHTGRSTPAGPHPLHTEVVCRHGPRLIL
jgi:hypothetical protein